MELGKNNKLQKTPNHEPGCIRRLPEETPPDVIMDGKPGVHKVLSYIRSCLAREGRG